MKCFNTYIALERVNEFSEVQKPMGTDKNSVIRQGRVLEVDESANESGFKKGDILIFPDFANIPIKVQGKEYVFVKEEEVICKL